MVRSVLLAALVVPFVSLAASFAITVPGGISLETANFSDISSGDIRITDGQIWSRGGIRVSADQDFHESAPMIMESPLEVRGADGEIWKLVVWDLKEGHATVELLSAQKREEKEVVRGPARRFRLAEMSLNGEPTLSKYPDLILNADGTYRFGTAQGRWEEGEEGLRLDGYYSAWGTAAMAASQELTFHFARGGHRFEMRMERSLETANQGVARN